MREIHTTFAPLLLLSQSQAFASHFPEIKRLLELRQYDRAAKLMRRYLNYSDGESRPAYGFSIYAIKGRFRDFFVEAYQGQFCFGAGYLPSSTAGISEMPFLLAQALRSAVDGNYVESQRQSLTAFQNATWVGFPLLMDGVLDILLKRSLDARREWASIFYVPEQVYPEQIGPSADKIQAAEFLIHFRP